jgi:death-on-curing protein
MIELATFLLAAEQVLGIDAERLARVTKIAAAESALAAPFASFGGHDFYEHPLKRAAVLGSRLMRNHPLPDGNKRVALVLMRMYLREQSWELVATPREIDRTFRAVAARRMTEDYFHVWLISRTERIAAARGGDHLR